MTEARTSRADDRPPAGLSTGLLIVAAVIVAHLFFALVIGLGGDEPALAEPGTTGPGAACVVGASGDPAEACVPAVEPGAPAPEPPFDAAEPAPGGRGSY